MTIVSIPEWNTVGLLPPINQANPISPERSPYNVALLDVIMRFATSPERRQVLLGFLDYRAALHGMGLVNGFQWLDGSFLEQVEALEGRPPRDMDVVTFFDLPQGLDQRSLAQRHGTLFDQKHVKATYTMDAYFVVLGEPTVHWHVKSIAYWYSMWSHRRDGLWKGFVQVDLDPAQDGNARAILNLAGGVRHD